MGSDSFRVLVLGLDGATFDLMLPWMEEGRLPNLAGLLEGGAWSRLRSTLPPITPCAWSSFMTGKNPGKHGLFDFVEPSADGYGFRFTNAASRRSETIWGCLSRNGSRVGVVNVPMTYPPEEVNGYLISGLDTPHEGSDYCYPAKLTQELRERSIPYRVDLRHLGDMRTDARRDRRLADMREMESIRTDALRFLTASRPSDFTMIVYIAVDQVQHHFWHYMDPEHDKYDAAGAAKYEHVIRDMYVHLDGLIGTVLAQRDERTIVMVMSDHGFGPTSSVRIRMNQALADAGLLNFCTEGNSGRFTRAVALRLDGVLRSTLSSRAKSVLAAMMPRLRVWFERLDEAKVDYASTRAYANEVYRASPAVWINRQDRNAQGTVDREALSEVMSNVERALADLKDPVTSAPAISHVYRACDVYTGPFADRAPDLFPSWWEDGFLLDPSQPLAAGQSVVRSRDKVVGGVEFAGGHRIDGVFIMNGGPTKPGCGFEGAEIIDIAPTALYLMGHPVPDDMDGHVLTEVLDPAYVEAHPIEYEQASPTNGAWRDDKQPETSDADREMIAKRLQALGYIE